MLLPRLASRGEGIGVETRTSLLGSSRPFRLNAIAAAAAAFLYLLVNLFVLGGDSFVFSLNSTAPAVLAAGISILAFAVWQTMTPDRRRSHLPSGLVLAWGLWALAELIWAGASLLGKEPPYPGLADLFWLIGYGPMVYGLMQRFRTMPVRPAGTRRRLVWTASLLTFAAVSMLIFYPLIVGFDPSRLVESILNLVYPLCDLVLLTMVWQLFFTYEHGDYGLAWQFLVAGFVTLTFADLLFAYATWEEVYYPDGVANLISRGVDFPYTLSYLLWFVGVTGLRILATQHARASRAALSGLAPLFGHIMVFTLENDTILDFTPNLDRLMDTDGLKGASILGLGMLAEPDARRMLETLHSGRPIADAAVRLTDRSGAEHELTLSAIPVRNPQGEYTGANMLLTLPVLDSTFDRPLDHDARAAAKYVLDHSGSRYRDRVREFLLEYHLRYVRAIANRLRREGGAPMFEAFIAQLRSAAGANNLTVQFEPQAVIADIDCNLETLREALPILDRAAREFASQALAPQAVSELIERVGAEVDATVHQQAEYLLQPGSELKFSDEVQP